MNNIADWRASNHRKHFDIYIYIYKFFEKALEVAERLLIKLILINQANLSSRCRQITRIFLPNIIYVMLQNIILPNIVLQNHMTIFVFPTKCHTYLRGGGTNTPFRLKFIKFVNVMWEARQKGSRWECLWTR